MSIPPKKWTYSVGRSEAFFDGVGVAVHAGPGGTGINSCDDFSVAILWPDKTTETLGKFFAEELRLPNHL
jgi:hypothetical protein